MVFTKEECNFLYNLIGNSQIGNGFSLNDIEKGFELKEKFNASESDEGKLDIKLSDKEKEKIKKYANSFNNYPAEQWALDFASKINNM